MNNFPAMTEEQRHKMISDCQAEIVEIEKALTTWGEGWISYLQSKLTRQKIALAALTAKSIAWIETGTDGFQRGSRLINYFTSDIQGFDNGTLIYTAPPAPVLKPIVLPGKGGVEATSDKSIRDWSNGWAAYREEAIKAIRDAGYEVKS